MSTGHLSVTEPGSTTSPIQKKRMKSFEMWSRFGIWMPRHGLSNSGECLVGIVSKTPKSRGLGLGKRLGK